MSDNGDHEAFDLEGDGETIAMFPESEEEKDARRRFYDTTPARSDEHVDARINTISLSGSLSIPRELQNLEVVTVSFADADGVVLASGVGSIRAGFKFHETKEANIAERAHKAKLR